MYLNGSCILTSKTWINITGVELIRGPPSVNTPMTIALCIKNIQ
jgi:hypothetical protein